MGRKKNQAALQVKKNNQTSWSNKNYGTSWAKKKLQNLSAQKIKPRNPWGQKISLNLSSQNKIKQPLGSKIKQPRGPTKIMQPWGPKKNQATSQAKKINHATCWVKKSEKSGK